MKIGLIGINMYPKWLNWACPVHTFAFQQFLKSEGIDATIVDYKPVYFDNFDMKHPADYYNKLLEREIKSLELNPLPADSELYREKQDKIKKYKAQYDDYSSIYEEREIRYEKFQSFIDKYLIKTDESYDSDLLEVKDPGFDCYICVTDVIWKALPKYYFDRGFLLASKAMENKQKISYSVSRGVFKGYTEKEKALFTRYIEDIDYISVREEDLNQWIKDNTNKQSFRALDPVFLPDPELWDNVLVKPKEENYLLLYYVMENANDTVNDAIKYAKKHGLKIVELADRPIKGGKVNDSEVEHISRYDVGVDEWLGYMKYAECIFTNSFHGCCFSIVFQKQLFAGKRNGNKIDNLLNIFNLTSRKLVNIDIENDDIPEIDFGPVNKILEVEREKSVNFILDAIKSAETNFKNDIKHEEIKYEEFRRSLSYPIKYHSGKIKNDVLIDSKDKENNGFEKKRTPSGAYEYTWVNKTNKNDGSALLSKCLYHIKGYSFVGWTMRIRIDNRWFWFMNDGKLLSKSEMNKQNTMKRKVFKDNDYLPYLPVNNIGAVIMEAQWVKKKSLKDYVKRVVKKIKSVIE